MHWNRTFDPVHHERPVHVVVRTTPSHAWLHSTALTAKRVLKGLHCHPTFSEYYFPCSSKIYKCVFPFFDDVCFELCTLVVVQWEKIGEINSSCSAPGHPIWTLHFVKPDRTPKFPSLFHICLHPTYWFNAYYNWYWPNFHIVAGSEDTEIAHFTSDWLVI